MSILVIKCDKCYVEKFAYVHKLANDHSVLIILDIRVSENIFKWGSFIEPGQLIGVTQP